MSSQRLLFALAGTMVLLSVLLTRFVHPGFVWMTVLVGANLVQLSITGICPALRLMARLGIGARG